MKYLTTIPLKLKTPNGELTLNPGDTFKPKCEDAIKPLLEEGKIRPLSKVFEERFNELANNLSHYALTADEIKTQKPELYKQIQEAITEMDIAWLKEDLNVFLRATSTVEELYFKALQEIPEW